MGSSLPLGLRLQSATLHTLIKRRKHYISEFIRNSTPEKVRNLVLINVHKLLRTSQVRGLPYRYTLDPINICNLNCPLCPTGTGKLAHGQGKMRFEDFQRIIDEIGNYAYTLDLFSWGEPFLHRDIFEMIRYATAKSIRVRVSTNLNVFSERMALQVIESQLADLIVSLDGPNQEIYQKYRVGGRFDRVINNLDLLVKKKKELKSRKPFITVLTVVTKKNEAHIAEIRSLSERIGADAYSASPVFIDPDNQQDIETWLPSQPGNRLTLAASNSASPKRIWDCATDLWGSCSINADGTVMPCCWVHDAAHAFGNVMEETLGEVWNNELYINSRRVFQFAGRDTPSPETICTQCRGYPKYHY